MNLIPDKFLDRIAFEPMSGCWLWNGATRSNGYGTFTDNGKSISAHRFSYTKAIGPIPEGLTVCHKCDLRCCVNPSHLFVGTQSDNLWDASRKGRLRTGERNHKTKLTREDVLAIRASDKSGSVLGREFGVWQRTISDIKRCITWRNV